MGGLPGLLSDLSCGGTSGEGIRIDEVVVESRLLRLVPGASDVGGTVDCELGTAEEGLCSGEELARVDSIVASLVL